MTKAKTKIDLIRVNINLPKSLVDEVKEYADNIGINTTSAYIVLLNQALDYQNIMSSMPLVLDAYKQLQESTSENDK